MISVIVTVYNKEPYIRRCIESIENNTYKDIELIIVEDCSTDNSMKVIEELMFEYNNITLIQNETNQGAGYSRNVGIKAAKGEWISLIDSDDWIDEDYFQTYLDRVEDDVDIIYGGFNFVINDNSIPISKRINMIFNHQQEKILLHDNNLYLHYISCSLIKKALFNIVSYSLERFIEDLPTAYMLLFHAEKVQTINYCGYNYRYVINSLMRTNSLAVQSLQVQYNIINVIEHIKKYDENFAKKMYRYYYNKIKNISFLTMKNYYDLCQIFPKFNIIYRYYNLSIQDMDKQKNKAIKLRTAKITKIK